MPSKKQVNEEVQQPNNELIFGNYKGIRFDKLLDVDEKEIIKYIKKCKTIEKNYNNAMDFVQYMRVNRASLFD